MIRSMTGFASCDETVSGRRYQIALKSLNSKGCDIRIISGKGFAHFEPRIVDILQKRLERGRVDLSYSIAATSGAPTVAADKAAHYMALLQSLRVQLGLKDEIQLSHLLGFREIFEQSEREGGDELWDEFEPKLQAVVSKLLVTRREEGEALEALLLEHIQKITSAIGQIANLVPAVNARIQQNLRTRLAEYAATTPPERFEQELCFYLARVDISEEVGRARHHAQQFEGVLASGEPGVGRRLGFITQELLREINTVGSKANSVDISTLVIDSKCELEKIREQIQNIE